MGVAFIFYIYIYIYIYICLFIYHMYANILYDVYRYIERDVQICFIYMYIPGIYIYIFFVCI